jgi:hypothetical protein
MQQYHRINPAGDCHQYSLPWANEPAGLDAMVNVVEQIAHSRMLFQQSGDARTIHITITNPSISYD